LQQLQQQQLQQQQQQQQQLQQQQQQLLLLPGAMTGAFTAPLGEFTRFTGTMTGALLYWYNDWRQEQ
jgi:hypothetical protein